MYYAPQHFRLTNIRLQYLVPQNVCYLRISYTRTYVVAFIDLSACKIIIIGIGMSASRTNRHSLGSQACRRRFVLSPRRCTWYPEVIEFKTKGYNAKCMSDRRKRISGHVHIWHPSFFAGRTFIYNLASRWKWRWEDGPGVAQLGLSWPS